MAGRLQDVILRGLAASKPLATTVAPGTLYYSTDTSTTERCADDGLTWQTYSDGSAVILSHAPTHSLGGTDPVDVKNLAGYPGTTTVFLRGDHTFASLPSVTVPAHATTHQPGGSDAMTVDASPSVGSLRTLGTGANQAAAGNDSRFASGVGLHASSHSSGGTDAVDVKNLAGYPGGTTSYLRADHTFATIPATTTGGSAGLVLLESLTASNSGTLDFSVRNAPGQSGPLFQSDYDEYQIEVLNVVPTVDANLYLLVSSDSGSTWVGGTNYLVAIRYSSTGGAVGNQASGAGQAQFNIFAAEATSSAGIAASIKIFSPLNTTVEKLITVHGSAHNTDGLYYNFQGSLIFNSAAVVNALRFKFSTGNISTGIIRVYGVDKSGTPTDPANRRIGSITVVIDAGTSVISTGVKGYLEIPFACTIQQVTMLADQSGSIVVDIWKDTYANYPPTVADTITASAKPTLSSAIKSQDATLTGWNTAIIAGDILGFNVNSATTITQLTLAMKVLI